MKLKYLFFVALILNLLGLKAQFKSFNAEIELQGGYNGPNSVPFWIRSNQYGSIPPEGIFTSVLGTVKKSYSKTHAKNFDWGFSAESRLNVGSSTNISLIEGFGKIRLSVFELRIGRSKDIIGLCDTSLTSGSYAGSGNSLGIPKVEISIPEFYTIPFLGKLFAFKGNFVHGWMGNTYKNFDTLVVSPTYLHQKSLYGRFGKPEWRLKLYGGFNHEVVWGDEGSFMGDDYTLSLFQSFLYVMSGKRFNNNSIEATRIGNHLGTIDIGLTYDFKNSRLLLYRQSIYEGGALYYFANIVDGLNGLSITSTTKTDNKFQWHKFVLEFLYTKNQAGETWSRRTPSNIENYFNNGYYIEGWSYKEKSIGTPFISPKGTIKDELPVAPDEYFVNSRVIAFHLGVEASLFDVILKSKFSFSRNYGTYHTAAEGNNYDVAYSFPSPYGIFPITNQFSGLLEASKELKKGITLRLLTAGDIGELYDNTFALICSVSKRF